jgi:hypothetical protein
MMAMIASAPLDEYVILSGDSDFTPLIHHLRATDKSVIVATTQDATDALRNSAERVFYVRDLVTQPTAATVAEANVNFQGTNFLDNEIEGYRDLRLAELESMARQIIHEAKKPINLAQLGDRLRDDFAQVISATNWAGRGSLKRYLISLDEEGWEVVGHYFASRSMDIPSMNLPALASDLPAELEKQLRSIGIPVLKPATFQALFESIKEYADTQTFEYSTCAVWIRDSAPAWARAGSSVDEKPSRSNINRVVRGCHRGGLPLQQAKGRSSLEIGKAFLKSIFNRLEYSDSFTKEIVEASLSGWLPR